MNTDPARIPVIIGVGQINDRENVHDALGLMVAALEAADMDAGGGWISQLGSGGEPNQLSKIGGLRSSFGHTFWTCAQIC